MQLLGQVNQEPDQSLQGTGHHATVLVPRRGNQGDDLQGKIAIFVQLTMTTIASPNSSVLILHVHAEKHQMWNGPVDKAVSLSLYIIDGRLRQPELGSKVKVSHYSNLLPARALLTER